MTCFKEKLGQLLGREGTISFCFFPSDFYFLCLFSLILYLLVYVEFSYLQLNLDFTFLEFTFSLILCTFLSVMPKFS